MTLIASDCSNFDTFFVGFFCRCEVFRSFEVKNLDTTVEDADLSFGLVHDWCICGTLLCGECFLLGSMVNRSFPTMLISRVRSIGHFLEEKHGEVNTTQPSQDVCLHSLTLHYKRIQEGILPF